MFYFSWGKFSLCSPHWPGIHYGSSHYDSVFELGVQVCATTHSSNTSWWIHRILYLEHYYTLQLWQRLYILLYLAETYILLSCLKSPMTGNNHGECSLRKGQQSYTPLASCPAPPKLQNLTFTMGKLKVGGRCGFSSCYCSGHTGDRALASWVTGMLCPSSVDSPLWVTVYRKDSLTCSTNRDQKSTENLKLAKVLKFVRMN